jgi:hypothetical protein
MNVIPDRAELLPPTMDWRDSDSYLWVTALPRPALAWEFVRRSPSYRAAYQSSDMSDPESGSLWPMVRLEDPRLDARHAVPVWSGAVCDDILPLRTGAQRREAITCRCPTPRHRRQPVWRTARGPGLGVPRQPFARPCPARSGARQNAMMAAGFVRLLG